MYGQSFRRPGPRHPRRRARGAPERARRDLRAVLRGMRRTRDRRRERPRGTAGAPHPTGPRGRQPGAGGRGGRDRRTARARCNRRGHRWHISPVRQAVAKVTANRVPYVYGPLYEGGERTPGLFLTGETPSRQLLPAMDWMNTEFGVDRWVVIGNDYVWPRETGTAARAACPGPGASPGRRALPAAGHVRLQRRHPAGRDHRCIGSAAAVGRR